MPDGDRQVEAEFGDGRDGKLIFQDLVAGFVGIGDERRHVREPGVLDRHIDLPRRGLQCVDRRILDELQIDLVDIRQLVAIGIDFQ